MNKILVVDDEKSILTMFSHLLPLYGYSVLTSENGTTGIELFLKERPAAVITGIKMPGIDGIEVLKRIKTIDPETNIIVITGHGDNRLKEQALSLKANDYINKPFNCNALDEALERLQQRLVSRLHESMVN